MKASAVFVLKLGYEEVNIRNTLRRAESCNIIAAVLCRRSISSFAVAKVFIIVNLRVWITRRQSIHRPLYSSGDLPEVAW